MATYKILLANPYAIVQHWHDQVYDVQDIFRPVLKHSSKYNNIHVRSEYIKPVNFSCDLVIYVIPSPGKSLVGAHFGAGDLSGSDGYTGGAWEDGRLVVGSEIFMANLLNVRQRSLLIYHEAMHNILKLDDKGLHGKGGLAGGEINADTKRKTENDKLIGKQLAKTPVQWQGGWKAM